MKKSLKIISIIGASSALLVVPTLSIMSVISDRIEKQSSYWNYNNTVEGVSKKTKDSRNENNLFHTFMADAFHNYGVYNVQNKDTKVENYVLNTGHENSFKNIVNYVNDDYVNTGVKGETVFSQLIFASKKDVNDILVNVKDKNDLEKKGIFVSIKREGFTFNTWSDETTKRPWATAFKNQNQRIADSLHEFTNEDKTNGFKVRKEFVQPFWVEIKILDNAKVGETPIEIITESKSNKSAKSKNVIYLDVLNMNMPNKNDVNQFTLGAAPFVYTDIAKYSQRTNGKIDVNNVIGFLSPEHKKFLEPKLDALKSRGQDFIWSWASNQSEWMDRYEDVRPYNWDGIEDEKNRDNAFLDGSQTGLVKWKLNEDNTWSFDFGNYDKLISYIGTKGFTKFWAGNLIHNIDVDKDGNFKDAWKKIQYYNSEGKLVYREMNLNPEYISDDKNDIYINVVNEFMKAFNSHVGKNPKVVPYIVFDEVNKETVKYISNLMLSNNYSNLKKHAYAGWKWSINIDDKEEWNDLIGGKNAIDDLVFGGYKIQEMFEDFIKTGRARNENEAASIIKKISDERRKNGLTTMMYAARSTYPSTLVQSDYGDNLWSGLYSEKMGLDGYFKWAFDKWVDNSEGDPGVADYGDESVPSAHRINSDPYNDGGYLVQSPTGDEFFIYPSVDHKRDSNYVSSVRWELVKYSQEQVMKLRMLNKKDLKIYNEIINNVKWPANPSKDKSEFAKYEKYYMWNSNIGSISYPYKEEVSASFSSIYAVNKLNLSLKKIIAKNRGSK